jgi:glycosyltransferase involved in cell wall biosynthesis
MTLRVLCVTNGGDRPTIATFIGMSEAGIDVTVVCPADHPNNAVLEDAGIRTVDIPLKKNFDSAGIRKLRNELIRGEYQILHSFNSRALTNGLSAARGLPVKIVCYRGIVGNVSFFDPISWLRYLNPRIDRIVCVCEAVRQYFLSMRPKFLRMPPNRPVTIYKGHRLEWYTEQPIDLASLGIPAGAFVIGCTTNYRPRKGIEHLVEAMSWIRKDIDAHLLLIGHMDSKLLDQMIEQSDARERIHRVGYRKDAPAIIAACDVACLPSTKREGLARSLIEAMAYGVPPVVSNCGGNPELVINGESGIVVPVRDSIALARAFEELFDDPRLRQRIGEAARHRIATQFRCDDTVKKTIELYQELVPQQELRSRGNPAVDDSEMQSSQSGLVA